MAAPQSAHRSVFVGNIPYDVTEEQLKEICEEVGPVVSFRLVVDRETGKPKGYGFCEYKDEETAASARRNLSGYEINGRQLRVDFAENGKNADKNREQGRGGPGMAPTADHQKQIGGTAFLVDAALHHPLGVSLAVAGANIMAQALGGAQNIGMLNHLGLPSQQVLGTDPLTQYLAKMSRNQLSEIISEVKDMATQNKEQARQVLLAYPTLPKALFQAQIMLGIVPAEMLQMPNVPQISALPQFLTQPQTQLPQLMLNKIILPGQLLGQSPATLPSIRPQPPLGGFSFRPLQVANSSALKQQIIQPSLVQDPLQVMNSTSLAHVQPFQSIRSQISDQNVQVSSLLPGVADLVSKDPRRQVTLDPRHHPSKLVKLNDGRTAPPSITTADMAASSTIFSAPLNHVSRVDKTLESGHHATQMVLPPEVDPALLQQVLHLTPEQLSSLAPDQQQQVRQLQEMLRRQSTQLKK